MRIRTRIAIIYTQLTFLVLLAAFTVVYLITGTTSEASFYDALWDRAVIIAQMHYEKDEMSEQRYRTVLNNYQFTLFQETYHNFNADHPHVADSLKGIVPNRLIPDLLSGNTVEFRTGNRQSVGIYYPDNEGNFVIVVSAFDKQTADSQQRLLELLAIILVSSTLLVYLIGLVYARGIMAPINQIIQNVKQITANNLKRSLREKKGNDELSELSRTFNDMIERLRNAFDMQNSFIRNASHELRNPLTAILGEAELALSRPRTEEQYVKTLTTVVEEADRLSSMMQDLLMLAQTDFDFSRVRKEEVDLREVMEYVIREMRKIHPDTQITLACEKKKYTIQGSFSFLKLVYLNVIGNAVKFSRGLPVEITLSETSHRIVAETKDRGIGIPKGELKKVFQPFYRGSNTDGFKGTGIGLALSKRIVELHSGEMKIDSVAGTGTVVTTVFRKSEEKSRPARGE